jgi:serine/threonine protein kinase
MSAPLAAGTLVAGRYRVEAPIGEGGHGVVYRAADTSVGRSVALKLLHSGMPGVANLEARFEQEARLARQLQHPNTVRLLDFGRAEDGALYIAYELLEGVPMDQAIDAGGPMSPDRVARIGAQVLKSLMEAHQHGVVHRDIKPSNIFLCNYSGEPDFVKVLDFGIAKSVEVGGQLTRTGFVVGTPSYMAPEQVRGDQVRPATDLYALGLLLAEALSGQIIVFGNTDAVIAAAQLSPDPVQLPPAVLQSPLAGVIQRATEKPLDRRYTAAQAMLDELSAVHIGPSSAVISSQERISLGNAPTGMLGPTQVAPYAPVPAPAMPAPAPMPVPQPLTKPGGGGVGLFLGILAVAVLAVVFIVGGFMWTMSKAGMSDPIESSKSDIKSKKKKKNKKKGSGRKQPKSSRATGDLAKLTLTKVESRLASAGWQVFSRGTHPVATKLTHLGIGTTDLEDSREGGTVYFANGPKAVEQLLEIQQIGEVHVVFDGDRGLGTLHFSKGDADALLDHLTGVASQRRTPGTPPETQPELTPWSTPKPRPSPTPTPRPASTPRPPSPKPSPKPSPTPRPTSCPPNDLMCNMKKSQKKK